MTNAVTSSVIYCQLVEDEAAASSSHNQEDRISERPGPPTTGCQEPKGRVESDSTGARPRVEQSAVVPVETHTWEEVEGAVWQSVRGTSEGAMGYALAILDRIWTNVEERFRFQMRALQTGHQEGEELARNPQLQNLLGRT